MHTTGSCKWLRKGGAGDKFLTFKVSWYVGVISFSYKGEVERGRKNKGRDEGGRKGVGGEGDTIP